MASQVYVISANNVTPPFSGIACDVYGNQCQYVGSGTSFPHLFTLTSQFDTAPALLLKIIDSVGCEVSEIIYCQLGEDFSTKKQFQTFDYFFFMSGDQYDFQ
jgi:hypothetical protein